ncbi:MAG: hydroxypyruvate isomerase [Verrucomicrobia bacterium]|nr:hydroxypyruvate isomerase [Verrucomicrobiota bacterium]NBU11009.1 hydroxypyruvate isomerase [Pseudomonadota bacterium]NDA66227.1 hydroxypyruvate isomerase [Verrucomicrobiota bacterium]NDB75161.1 hydroxypyruvate isomerase [Verrucomicrobiota bacterium]NDD38227.1 hydroxypyruvate isomerase [Verrucomicrobiota bacterium]
MKTTRRSALQTAATIAGAAAVLSPSKVRAADAGDFYVAKNGRINQSVVTWNFRPLTIPDLAKWSVKFGIKSVELVGPEHWPMLKELGLKCAIAGSHGFAKGFAQKDQHAECLKVLEQRIEQCATHGVPSVITFSGFRKGLDPQEAFKNTVEGLKKIAPLAEAKKVTVALEMLNSKVAVEMKGHPDYYADNMDVSIDILKAVGSPYVKVLYDIYHVQIMHGDVIARLRKYKDYIAHYHTAGNPGRNEIDDTQEINYPPIMRAIAETGYTGYVGQEFIPLRDHVKSLNEAVKLCDV